MTDIEKLRDLCEASSFYDDSDDWVPAYDGEHQVAHICTGDYEQSKEDAELLASMRNQLPDIMDELQLLRRTDLEKDELIDNQRGELSRFNSAFQAIKRSK